MDLYLSLAVWHGSVPTTGTKSCQTSAARYEVMPDVRRWFRLSAGHTTRRREGSGWRAGR